MSDNITSQKNAHKNIVLIKKKKRFSVSKFYNNL